MTLRYDQVADLIKIVDASACDELVLETAELKLTVRRRAGAPVEGPAAQAPARQAPPEPLPLAAPAAATQRSPAAGASSPPELAGGREVRAPMVGTFYRAPSPDAPPFVEVGSVVAVGQPLCVIEVMKLFTTIYAEIGGQVLEIAATNAELVEYEQVLFVIEGG